MAGNTLSSNTGGPGRVYKHTGFTTTISDSFAYSGPVGMDWDGTDMPMADDGANKIVKFTGFSSTIEDSFAGISVDIYYCCWDGTNLLFGGYVVSGIKKIKYAGFSSTILDSYVEANWTASLSWDGTNQPTGDNTLDKILKESGFSSTIIDSFAATGTGIEGLVWDGANVVNLDTSTNKIYKYTGFTSTVSDSIATPSTAPRGVGDDSRNAAAPPSITISPVMQTGKFWGPI